MTIRSGKMKSSIILISAGKTEAVYKSVKDVPPRLRRKLLKSTNGLNAATILIADRRGRQEIAKAVQSLSAGIRSAQGLSLRLKAAIAGLLATGSLGLIWFLFAHKWF